MGQGTMGQGTKIVLVLVGSTLAGVLLLCGLGGVAALVMDDPSADDDRRTSTAESSPTEDRDPDEPPEEPSEQPVVEEAATGEPAEPDEAEETFVVVNVVDGDTIDLDNGETVRLAGIDTPERGECGHERAASVLERLVLGERVRLVVSDEDRDPYDRLLRYVEVGNVDAGMRLLRTGLAIARYDSRDGYGRHPREDAYIAADEAAPDVTCQRPAPVEEPRGFADTGGGSDCAPGYDPCVPTYPPDLDCADTGPVTVTGPDPHGLDRDGDGVACGGD
ncbi:MAG TPA: thermonuclease family protein [Nocardioides sp.]|nr:thermonuclease family protein [Nocardioides sp.]